MGATLGRYQLGELIGRGGVAEVYEAAAEGAADFVKPVVVKRIRPELRDIPEIAESFVAEARIARRIQHGNVVQVIDLGLHDGQPYIVFERIDGCSLFDLMRTRPAMPVSLAVHVVEQVCAGLHHAHGLVDERGVSLEIVHRDVTPKNILLSCDGLVKLTDFGIAKIRHDEPSTVPGHVKGTPRYLSPEQASAQPIDARSDIYTLGLVLRELVDGRGDAELTAIVERATSVAVAERFPTALAFARALQDWRRRRGEEVDPSELGRWVRDAAGRRALAAPRALDAGLHLPSVNEATAVVVARQPPSTYRWPLALGGSLLVGVGLWIAAQPRLAAPMKPLSVLPALAWTHDDIARPRPASIRWRAPLGQPQPVATSDEPSTRAPAVRSRLMINVLPWANVSIDGKVVGRTPIDVRVRPGRHIVELHNPELDRRAREVVQLEAGRTVQLQQWRGSHE